MRINNGDGGEVKFTASDDEDAGAADGWSISDNRYIGDFNDDNTWASAGAAGMIRVNGYANADPSTTLVSNTGQSKVGVTAFTYDQAQAFTTGNDANGYKLTSANISFVSIGGSPSYTVSIRESDSGNPGIITGNLTKPASLATGLNTFTADGAGIDLSPQTDYFVVVDSTASTANTKLQYTTSNNEDSGAADGWSLADGFKYRNWNSGQSAWSVGGSHAMHVSISGYSKGGGTLPPPGAPTVTGAAVDRTNDASGEVVITFSKDLDTGSVPATGDFEVQLIDSGGTGWKPNINHVSFDPNDASKVILDFSQNTGPSTVGWVRYTQPASNPLQDDNGNLVESFVWPEGATTPSTTPSTPQQPSDRPPSTAPGSTDDDDRETFPGPWISPKPHNVDTDAGDIIVTMDKDVYLGNDYTSQNLASAFTVYVNSVRYTPTAASVSGDDVRLTLSIQVPHPYWASVEYRAGPLVDAGSETVDGFAIYTPDRPVSPKYNRMGATDPASTILRIDMDSRVKIGMGYDRGDLAGAFTIYVNGVRHTPTSASIDDGWWDILLDMGFTITDDDCISIYYRSGGSGPLTDKYGFPVNGFSVYPVCR